MPLGDANKLAAGNGAVNDGILTVGGRDCIAVKLADRTATGTVPAYIVFAKKSGGGDVCTQVQNAAPVQAYFDSRVEAEGLILNNDKGAIAIGSSTTIY